MVKQLNLVCIANSRETLRLNKIIQVLAQEKLEHQKTQESVKDMVRSELRLYFKENGSSFHPKASQGSQVEESAASSKVKTSVQGVDVNTITVASLPQNNQTETIQATGT